MNTVDYKNINLFTTCVNHASSNLFINIKVETNSSQNQPPKASDNYQFPNKDEQLFI